MDMGGIIFIFLLLLPLIGGGLLAARILSNRFCDVCKSSALCRPVDGFTVCDKCVAVARTTGASVSELIAKRESMPVSSHGHLKTRKSAAERVAPFLGIPGLIFLIWFAVGLARTNPNMPGNVVQGLLNSDSRLRETLLGSWLLCDPSSPDTCFKLVFERDGSCVVSIQGLEFRGTWAVSDRRLTTKIESGNLSATLLSGWQALWGESMDLSFKDVPLGFSGGVCVLDNIIKMQRLGAPPK